MKYNQNIIPVIGFSIILFILLLVAISANLSVEYKQIRKSKISSTTNITLNPSDWFKTVRKSYPNVIKADFTDEKMIVLTKNSLFNKIKACKLLSDSKSPVKNITIIYGLNIGGNWVFDSDTSGFDIKCE